MTYEYWCEKCEKVISLEKSMKEDIPESIKCDVCKSKASRIWSNMSIHIPEFMRAASTLYNGDSGSNSDYLKGRMNKGVRPSGKQKVFY